MGPLIGTATVLFLIAWGGRMFGFGGHFYVMAAGFIGMLLISIFWLRDYPEEKGRIPDNDPDITVAQARDHHERTLKIRGESTWTIKKLLKTRQVWQIGIGVGGIDMLIGNAVMSQIVPTIMSYGYERLQAMTMVSVLAICAVPMSYFFGAFDARFGTRKTIMVFFTWGILALLFMVLPGKWTIFVSIFMIGGYIGGAGNLQGAMVTTVFGRYDFAKAFSVVYPMCVIVRSCSYMLIGTLSAKTGGYTVPYIVLMCAATIGIINAYLLDDRMIGKH
jgi:MFS family permease